MQIRFSCLSITYMSVHDQHESLREFSHSKSKTRTFSRQNFMTQINLSLRWIRLARLAETGVRAVCLACVACSHVVRVCLVLRCHVEQRNLLFLLPANCIPQSPASHRTLQEGGQRTSLGRCGTSKDFGNVHHQ